MLTVPRFLSILPDSLENIAKELKKLGLMQCNSPKQGWSRQTPEGVFFVQESNGQSVITLSFTPIHLKKPPKILDYACNQQAISLWL